MSMKSVNSKMSATVWRLLKHDNVLPFYGVCLNEFAPLRALVSPWMPIGDLRKYLQENSSAGRRQLASHLLSLCYPKLIGLQLKGISSGLQYLHAFEPKVIHGDVRAVSVIL